MKKINKLNFIIFIMVVVFFLILCCYISIPSSRIKQQKKFYSEQQENSIDIAFIGSSATYVYYDVMEIWNEYGITSMCYYEDSITFDVTETMIEYVEINQNPEFYVVDLRDILIQESDLKYYGMSDKDRDKSAFISVLNLFPASYDKFDLINNSIYTCSESYMHQCSVLYNHTTFLRGVKQLVLSGFKVDEMQYKGNQLRFDVTNLESEYVDFSEISQEEYELTDTIKQQLLDFFEFCEINNINVYFTFTPYVGERCDFDQDIRSAIGEYVMEQGYFFTDFMALSDEIGLDVTTDFSDVRHVNAVGAEKYTLYAMECFLEEYKIVPNYSVVVIDEWNTEYSEWIIYKEEKLEILYEEIEEVNSSMDNIEASSDY